jgi:hypothetical protein
MDRFPVFFSFFRVIAAFAGLWTSESSGPAGDIRSSFSQGILP